jgi:hypothetical protein
MSRIIAWGLWILKAAIIVAIVAVFAMAILILVNQHFGSRFNPSYLAADQYDNRVKVAQMLISVVGFSATLFALLRGVEVIRRGQRGPMLLALAELRTTGVDLRNEGTRGMTKEQRDDWWQRVEDWKLEVYSKTKELSEFESEKLRTLDTFTLLQLPEVEDAEARRKVSELHATLERLYETLQHFR